MNLDQIEAFAKELGIDPYEDVAMLIIVYHMKCADQGVITKDEFVTGFRAMGAETTAALQKKVAAVVADTLKRPAFDAFYKWAYKFNCEPGQKTLKLDTAIALTAMLLPASTYRLSPEWLAFLRSQSKTVSRDTWEMILEFFRTIKADLSNYDGASSAWPVQIDEFVDFLRKGGSAASVAAGGAGAKAS